MRRLASIATSLLVLTSLAGVAQTLPAPGAMTQIQGANNGLPIEIVARDGIEWDREQLRYVARGAAKVTQGDKTVEADTLTALYRQTEGGNTQIYRYTANGSVRVSTPTQRAVGDVGVYDVDTGVIILTGKNMKITTPDQEITARDSLEYWEQKRLAVARGNAVIATTDGKRIGGETLAAYFDQPTEPTAPQGVRGAAAGPVVTPSQSQRQATRSPLPDTGGSAQNLDRVEAFGNVIVSTPTDIAQGEKAVYNAKTGIALLTGNVKLTRGRNQANGDFLEINLNSGLYKLGCRPGAGSSCVRGLFVPEKKDEGAPPR